MKGANRQRIGKRSIVVCLPRSIRFIIALIIGLGISVYLKTKTEFPVKPVQAQIIQAQADSSIQKQEDQLIRQFVPPPSPPPAPVYRPAPPPAPAPAPAVPDVAAPTTATPGTASTSPSVATPANQTPATPSNAKLIPYVLEFSRSPVVGNRLHLQGLYAEARIGFTRPKNWHLKTVKALIRYQHSPALLASRSNLTVQVNKTNVGSVPLNRKQSQIGELEVNIPASLIQNYNELAIVAQQNNSDKGCPSPSDQTLWTEVLPDSKVVFGFQPKAIPLDFSSYPYPFFDDLSLDANSITYLLPKSIDSAWLTTTARFHAGLGRLADFHPLETQTIRSLSQLRSSQKLVIIGTPLSQPDLKSLKLPYAIVNNQLVDGNRLPLPEDVGLLMLTIAQNGNVPILVISGNGAEGIAKATQFLLQPKQRQMGIGSAVLVDQVTDVPPPPPRQWSRYLPEKNSFQLQDLRAPDNQPWQDVTVRGSYTPPIEFDFRALPDEQINRGSSMTLYYSHSPQINPRLSTLEVRLDGAPIAGKQLTAEQGTTHDALNINFPENRITPTSKLQVAFNLIPRELSTCGKLTDQQLWGTVHNDTSFNLNRHQSVQLPDLKLLQAGYPFTAPQDLSSTAIVLPGEPANAEVLTLLQLSERLGRLSAAETVKLQVYSGDTIPEEVRNSAQLIGIGTRERFPFPEVFQTGGFQLDQFLTRRSDQVQIQTLPDTGGLVKAIISPWNRDRVLLILTAQSNAGLDKVRYLFQQDGLFFQLKNDTVLINTTDPDPSPYDPEAYTLSFFQQANRQTRIEKSSPLGAISRFLQENWYLLPTGIIFSTLMLYGIVQLYLKRVTNPKGNSR
ncbi:MAG: cellulose biosynthesis cyclic di-GMP-binding regulatory protein BcsB [Scytolyngbya sp. HA4215-MV1]|jgi:hypothetical protein|nr:cellulose biosynthesis cyclic di-GMP-binding regulatory protein BcsB [Scytolyngbya sp. HA4215-MV1]